MDEKEVPSLKDLMEKDIPHIYANGYMSYLGTSDIAIVLKHNDKPIGTISLAYNLAKTLSITLGEMIRELEKKTEQNIKTVNEIKKEVFEK